ncbi:MAG: hypothetical protein BROFUL_00314, partial [Candidatus Brocadia fulgida]
MAVEDATVAHRRFLQREVWGMFGQRITEF